MDGHICTLLGPEESAFGWLFWSSFVLRLWVPLVLWGWGCGVLVGLLFEICIVDASIFHDLLVWPCLLGLGGGLLKCAIFVFLRVFLHAPALIVGGGVCVVLTLLRQAMKGTWWMPWHQEPMKDVGACDKPRGVGNRAVIRGCPNGETQLESCPVTRI